MSSGLSHDTRGPRPFALAGLSSSSATNRGADSCRSHKSNGSTFS